MCVIIIQQFEYSSHFELFILFPNLIFWIYFSNIKLFKITLHLHNTLHNKWDPVFVYINHLKHNFNIILILYYYTIVIIKLIILLMKVCD